MAKGEQIDHPDHYNQGGIECIDAIEAALGPDGFIAWLRGTIIKYHWRLGLKDHPAQDAAKADWYSRKLVGAVKLQADLRELQEGRVIPTAPGEVVYESCTLASCPPGLFMTEDGHYGFKSEYRSETKHDPVGSKTDAYVVASGEYFWGGVTDIEAREQIKVFPVELTP